MPWLIESIEYVPREDGIPGMPYVCIQLLANTIAATTHVDDAAPDQWRAGMTSAMMARTIRALAKYIIMPPRRLWFLR